MICGLFAVYLRFFLCKNVQLCARMCNFSLKKKGANKLKITCKPRVYAERGGFEPPKRFRRLHAFQTRRRYTNNIDYQ